MTSPSHRYMPVRPPRDGEEVPVECWCRAEFVWVKVEEVRAGRTGSCGLIQCHPPR